MSHHNGNGIPLIGDYNRIALECIDLRAEVESLRGRLRAVNETLASLPSKRQIEDVLKEIEGLRTMNSILLRRNEVLNRKQRELGLP